MGCLQRLLGVLKTPHVSPLRWALEDIVLSILFPPGLSQPYTGPSRNCHLFWWQYGLTKCTSQRPKSFDQNTRPITKVSNSALSNAPCSITPPNLGIYQHTTQHQSENHSPIALHSFHQRFHQRSQSFHLQPSKLRVLPQSIPSLHWGEFAVIQGYIS